MLKQLIESIIAGDQNSAEKFLKLHLSDKSRKLLSGATLLEADAPEFPEENIQIPEVVTIETVESVVRKIYEQDRRRWELLIQRSADANDGLRPTLDRQGRYHAPRDGYVDPETDVIYRGGSYLPFPESYYEDGNGGLRHRSGGGGWNEWKYNARIKMPVENAKSLEETTKEFEKLFGAYYTVGTGKAWKDNSTGIEICYAYIKTSHKVLLEAITKFAEANEYTKQANDNSEAAQAREAERMANLPDWPEGRRVISGTVISIKAVDGYGYNQIVYKMLVQSDDGNKVYGSVPAAFQRENVDRGDKVKFEAAVQMKERGFYYFKRPTKPSLTKAE